MHYYFANGCQLFEVGSGFIFFIHYSKKYIRIYTFPMMGGRAGGEDCVVLLKKLFMQSAF